MKIKSAVFDVSAPDLKSCPRPALPEFAFIGRSNVGKSSLINMLTERKELAKISGTPGKTKLINFFIINDAWCVVDLPGYGYARAAKSDRAEFNKSVSDYLGNRENILCVFVLIDSRLPPQRLDLEFVKWLADGPAPFALVFTKTDKQTAAHSQANIGLFKQSLSAWWEELPEIFATSAKTGSGRSELLNFIGEILSDHHRA